MAVRPAHPADLSSEGPPGTMSTSTTGEWLLLLAVVTSTSCNYLVPPGAINLENVFLSGTAEGTASIAGFTNIDIDIVIAVTS